MPLRQRSLVNRRIAFRDAHMIANYVFPFWDASWSVWFVLIEVFGGDQPRVLTAPLDAIGADLQADAPARDARLLADVPRSAFAALYHFDPWWVFRGKGGVAGAYRDVVVPTNIAQPFRAGDATWKVHDVGFGPWTESAVIIEAKDESFERRAFTKADLDLATAFGHSRPAPKRGPESRPPSPKTI